MSEWHLDKRVPITLLIAIIAQTFALGWFIKGIDSRVALVEGRTLQLERDAQETREASVTNSTSIAVINQNLDEIHRTLVRIEKKMDEK